MSFGGMGSGGTFPPLPKIIISWLDRTERHLATIAEEQKKQTVLREHELNVTVIKLSGKYVVRLDADHPDR